MPSGVQTFGTVIERHSDVRFHGSKRHTEARGDRRVAQVLETAEAEGLGAAGWQFAQRRSESLQLATGLSLSLRAGCLVGDRQQIVDLGVRENTRLAPLRTLVIHGEICSDLEQEGTFIVQGRLAKVGTRDPDERLVREIRRIVLTDLAAEEAQQGLALRTIQLRKLAPALVAGGSNDRHGPLSVDDSRSDVAGPSRIATIRPMASTSWAGIDIESPYYNYSILKNRVVIAMYLLFGFL